ncbi:EamA family transporter [Pelosinus propionicus]|uniref:EamA-like transporter family protein n=1 Tax=Pelosinus propionicus DSM 13327 TaxID=1123291 RepID=A0A1I4K9L8_9FIRM|nr:EamA family transporter [Pelosinus propionicus]SFL75206.1 EamA-like transporter family protein [Pelosinus propionicus DSM 13327]
MTGSAIVLILFAAFGHATWNYLAKKACGGTAFIWLFAALSTLLYLPLALWIIVIQKPNIGWHQLGFMLGSAILHSLYYIMLDKGYRIGDLSVIYPLARGTGPMLSTIAAIVFLDEHPSAIALVGTVLIGLGIVVITGNPFKLADPTARKPMIFAILCGTMIAGYTLSDKLAVSTFLIPPLLLDWSANLGRVFLLTPYAFKNWDKIKDQWTRHKMEAISVAILCPLAYILVLTAMVFNPVSYIAPAREVSILIGTAMGARLLSEGNIKIRAIGASAMVIGLGALSIG